MPNRQEPPVFADPIVCRAKEFASRVHDSKERRNGKPFVDHLQRVALFVARWTNDPDIIAAAFLHDVMEGGCRFGDVAQPFGKKIADQVALLSKEPRGSKKEELVVYCSKLRRAPGAVKLVKAADIADNATDDPDPAWFPKAKMMLAAVKSGKAGGFKKAINSLARYARLFDRQGYNKPAP